MNGNRLTRFTGLFLSACMYGWLAYGMRDRSAFPEMLLCVVLLFGLYFWYGSLGVIGSLRSVLTAGLLFRLIFLISIPVLSDDFHRFFWDGFLMHQGYNPYLILPSAFSGMETGQAGTWLEKMNSPDFYSVYPPICQWFFWLATIGGDHVTWLPVVFYRFLLILADVASYGLLVKILAQAGHPKTWVYWYFLNPLIILELTGNLHPEALLIPLLLAFYYNLQRNRVRLSALFFGLAVGVKLWPLIFLPFLWRRLQAKDRRSFYLLACVIPLLLFLPFANETLLIRIFSSIDLYFRKFEFNASLYYVFNWLWEWVQGYPRIDLLGPVMALAAFFSLIIIAVREKKPEIANLPRAMVHCKSIYLLLAMVVHPWYLSTLVAFSSISRQRYVLFWSLLVFTSYHAYAQVPYRENGIWTAGEYFLVWIALLMEQRYVKKIPAIQESI